MGQMTPFLKYVSLNRLGSGALLLTPELCFQGKPWRHDGVSIASVAAHFFLHIVLSGAMFTDQTQGVSIASVAAHFFLPELNLLSRRQMDRVSIASVAAHFFLPNH